MTRLRIMALALCLPVVHAQAAEIAPDALDGLQLHDVVVLGEVHGNPAHHANQARAVRALEPAALVLEMLTPDQAAQVVPELRNDPRALAEALDWAQSGWPDFALYHSILAAAPDARVFGANVPRDEARRVFEHGLTAVFGADADRFGLDRALDANEQSSREAALMAAHCDALPPEILPGMVAAQRLRDAVLARAVIEAHDSTGGPVAVITGTGHARTDRGVAAKLSRAAPVLSVLSIGQFETAPGPHPPFDYWIVTGAVERPDPCAAFE